MSMQVCVNVYLWDTGGSLSSLPSLLIIVIKLSKTNILGIYLPFAFQLQHVFPDSERWFDVAEKKPTNSISAVKRGLSIFGFITKVGIYIYSERELETLPKQVLQAPLHLLPWWPLGSSSSIHSIQDTVPPPPFLHILFDLLCSFLSWMTFFQKNLYF